MRFIEPDQTTVHFIDRHKDPASTILESRTLRWHGKNLIIKA